VHAGGCAANLDAGGGLVFYATRAAALTHPGCRRDDAYRVVQRHALAAADRMVRSVPRALEVDPAVRERLDGERIAACFELEHFLRHVDAILRARRGAASVSATVHAPPRGATPRPAIRLRCRTAARARRALDARR